MPTRTRFIVKIQRRKSHFDQKEWRNCVISRLKFKFFLSFDFFSQFHPPASSAIFNAHLLPFSISTVNYMNYDVILGVPHAILSQLFFFKYLNAIHKFISHSSPTLCERHFSILIKFSAYVFPTFFLHLARNLICISQIFAPILHSNVCILKFFLNLKK